MRANPGSHARVILMADDDLDNHLIVKCALEGVGFRGMFLSVKDGLELLDYLCRRGKHRYALAPDLIILDLNMPGMDGRAVLREIKADPSFCHIPVAVVTSSSSEKDIELCGKFRKCTYTRKPATYPEWSKVMDDLLREHLPSWDPSVHICEEEVECFEQQ